MEISISGAKVYGYIGPDIPVLGRFPLSETLIVSWIVMLAITLFCIIITHNMKVEKISRRQALAEWLVEVANKFVVGNMGSKFSYMVPFVAGWAIVVFIMITAQKIKAGGFGGYLIGFTKPIPLLTPFNVLSELSTPISMACRHFGNILSGIVINGLIYTALAGASSALFGLIPGAVGNVLSSVPILDVGIPAILSFYFDWFTGVMQAYIFCMLTTMYIANAAEEG